MIIFPNKPGVFHIFLFTIGIHRLDLHGFQWLRESTAETGSNLDEAMLSQECCHDSWFHYVLFAISFGSTMSLCVYMCIMVYHINVLCGIMFHYMQITPITMFCFFFEIRLIRPENRAISRLVKKVDSMNFTRVLSGGEDVKLQDRMDRRFWESGDLSIINIYQLVGRWWFGTNSYKL